MQLRFSQQDLSFFEPVNWHLLLGVLIFIASWLQGLQRSRAMGRWALEPM